MDDMTQPLYAHTPPKTDPERWHMLDDHLRRVAEMAGEFGEAFGAGSVAFWAGIWHDLGKFNPAFQAYLRAANQGARLERVPHAKWGAVLAYTLLAPRRARWEEVALPMLGHHGGLPDAGRAAQDLAESSTDGLVDRVRSYARSLPAPSVYLQARHGTSRELFVRMVASALVDADYLDTEHHFNRSAADLRGVGACVQDLWKSLEAYQRRKDEEVNEPLSVVNSIRREVHASCLDAANGPRGMYKLTVPTGGGKTRSGLAFALKHAVAHGMRRVVVAIPYTSIVDQTAGVYRDILGRDVVIEDQSQVPMPDTDEMPAEQQAVRLAAENWDGPLIVTTTVQLLESLLERKPSKLRKVHRLANSVILLDEVQNLPPGMLSPTLSVFRELVDGYRTTVVLSTATQPAFDDTALMEELAGLPAREIVPTFRDHFRRLRRVRYEHWREPVGWAELAAEVARRRSALVILNTRRDALDLLSAMPRAVPGLFHLSTLLCGAHRREVLRQVTERLVKGASVHLVSTQVVECGVDLDFPTVYRALGPLDRIVQAAGRCNREGRRRRGRVVVFDPADGRTPRGHYKAGTEKTGVLLWKYPIQRLHDPAIYREYFTELYRGLDRDEKHVQDYRRELNYPEVARRYRLIPDDTVPVVVPYGGYSPALAAWQSAPSRTAWRQLQPFIVNLFHWEASRLIDDGWLEPISDHLFRWRGSYDPVRGIAEAVYDPADLFG